jgi:hypothetical protein
LEIFKPTLRKSSALSPAVACQLWQTDTITDAERAEVERLQSIIPEIRPLIQRLISLATELDARANTGTALPRKKWRH